MSTILARIGSTLCRLLLPEHCPVCGVRLDATEEVVCTTCLTQLPFTQIMGTAGNVVERLFWNRLPVVRASAYLHYAAGSETSQLFYNLKYYNRPRVGRFFGRLMAEELLTTGFFDGIDVIVPVPLHRRRQRHRGYNQSEQLACGLSAVTGLPVDTALVERSVDTPTQTLLDADARRSNVAEAFRLVHPERVAHRHLLLVDDVLTTGATLVACGTALAAAGDVRLSILTLGLAGHHHLATQYYERD